MVNGLFRVGDSCGPCPLLCGAEIGCQSQFCFGTVKKLLFILMRHCRDADALLWQSCFGFCHIDHRLVSSSPGRGVLCSLVDATFVRLGSNQEASTRAVSPARVRTKHEDCVLVATAFCWPNTFVVASSGEECDESNQHAGSLIAT